MSSKYFEKVLISKEQISEHCQRLGLEIENDYKDKDPAIFLGLLKGCHPFMSDLLKHIDLKLEIDYMDVSSFFGELESKGDVKIVKDMSIEVRDRDIVIVEDIVDSGRTIKKVMDLLKFRGAKSVKVVTLVDKPEGRKVDLVPDYIGQEIPKEFIMGYGLDYKELYRNIDEIGIPKEEVIRGDV